LKAQKEIDMLRNNPQLTLNMPKDVLEKDRIALWKPSDGLKMILAGDPQKIVRVFCAYKGFKIG
jgi:hypothetical protein